MPRGRERTSGARRPTPRAVFRQTARMLGRLAQIEWVAGLADAFVRRGKRVTLMFTDIEGFTAYAAQRGDHAAVRLLRRHDQAVLPAIRAHRGRVVKRLGDGLMVAFRSPEDAVRAALVMQRRLDGRRISLRVGVHVGEPVTVAGDLIGHDVNVAARVADRARGGQILVSEAVHRDVDGRVRAGFRKAGTIRLRGAKPVRLYEARRAD